MLRMGRGYIWGTLELRQPHVVAEIRQHSGKETGAPRGIALEGVNTTVQPCELV